VTPAGGPAPWTGIHAVTFDADETLWDFDASMRVALGHVQRALWARVPAMAHVDVDHLAAVRDEVAAEHGRRGHITMSGIRRLSFVRVLRDHGVDDPVLAEELSTIYFFHRHQVALFDDVIASLDQLPPHVELGLITNGNTDAEKSGLPGRFAFTVYADRVGVPKPDPAIYRIAIDHAGCEPHEIVHVGDDLTTDVVGPQAVGMRAVWINRTGAALPADARPDAVITSLHELPALIR
jgi:2-haloalkanoic acid dehalogenase type II